MESGLKNFFLFLFLSGVLICFSAQQNHVTYSVKDGLPSSRIYRMLQDQQGIMWFATNCGISKFDGTTFKNFTYKDGLPNQDVWELHVDEKNRLWFFAKSKLQGYIENDKVFVFPNSGNTGLSPNIFYGFGNQMILQTRSYLYEFKNSVFEELPVNNLSWISNNQQFWINTNPFQKKVAFNYKNHIQFLDYKTGQKTITKEYEYISKNIKIFPVSSYTYTYKAGSLNAFITYTFCEEGVFINDFQKSKAWFFSAQDLFGTEKLDPATKFDVRKNQIFLSSSGQIHVFDFSFRKLKYYNFAKKYSDNINSYIDRDGNFWHNNQSGLVFESASQHVAKHFLEGKRVQKLGFINKELFAGSDDNVYRIEPTTGHFSKENIGNGFVSLIDTENERIICKNLVLQKQKGGSWKEIKMPTLKPSNLKTSAKNYVVYNQKRFFLNTFGIAIESPTSANTEFIKVANLVVAKSYKNRLYFGGGSGLFIYTGKDVIPVFPDRFSYPITQLETIGDQLLIGTEGLGIFVFDGKFLYHIAATEGLVVSKILKDEHKKDVLWFSTQKGVKRLQVKGKNFRESFVTNTYTTDEGFFSDNVNDIALRDSILYTATDYGVNAIDLNTHSFYQPVNILFGTKNKKIIIPKDQKENIRIPFSAKDFVRSQSTRFYYRLLPQQKKWEPISSKEVFFHYLEPGNYVLELKSKTQHNTESVSAIALEVQPFWWEKISVIFSLGMLLLAIIILGIYISYLHFKNNYKKKTDKEKRIAGLELQALRSQMNPHFVHNSLNAIQYYIQRNEVEKSENYLTKFSKLIRMFFEYSSSQTISLRHEIELLENYLYIEKLRFEDKISYSIQCDEALRLENPSIPSMILQPVVENAINHGIFHKKEGGNIVVSFLKLAKNSIQIIIDDDGIGYKKSKKMKSGFLNSEIRSSKVLQERIHLLNKSGQYIEYEIVDKSDLDEMQTGTRVTLIISGVN